MKTWIDFAKTTAIGGFFGILPILLTFMVVTQAIDVLAGIATPIAAMLPVDEIGGVEIARVVALGLILAGCFLAGLLLRTRFGIWSSELVETAILNRLPGYPLLKTLSQRLGGMEDATPVAVANCFMQWGIGSKELLAARG
jgi:uncharacterized membrane protein